jgi:capsular polysaccharide biosynthesis protein
LLLLGIALGGGASYAVSKAMTPIYRASTTLLINQTQTPGVIAYNDILTSERLTKTYRELVSPSGRCWKRSSALSGSPKTLRPCPGPPAGRGTGASV